MPPKRRNAKETNPEENESSSSVETTCGFPNSFEAILDQRMKKQSKQLEDMFTRILKSTQDGVLEVKNSQDFISSKFDEVLNAIDGLRSNYNVLREENTQLKQRVNQLENKIASIDNECESLKQYSKRDLVEVHGIPENVEEDTDDLAQHVAELIDVHLEPGDISISPLYRLNEVK